MSGARLTVTELAGSLPGMGREIARARASTEAHETPAPPPDDRWPRSLLLVLVLAPPLLGLIFEPDGLRYDLVHQGRTLLAIGSYVMTLGYAIQLATDAIDARRPAWLLGRSGAMLHVAVAALLALTIAVVLGPILVWTCRGLEGRLWLLALRGALLAGVYVIAGRLYRSMRQARDRAVAASAERERALAEARYAALVSRTQPHFLHNALAAAAGLVPRDPAAAETLLRDLGALLREIVESSTSDRVRAEDELATARHYLAVQHARFGERVRFEVMGAEVARDVLVPPLVTLPFVENAVLHGLSDGQPVRITVRSALERDHLRFEIEDDGPGPGRSSHLAGTGVGVRDARTWLETLYGDEAGLRLEAVDESALRRGMRVVIRIPRGDT